MPTCDRTAALMGSAALVVLATLTSCGGAPSEPATPPRGDEEPAAAESALSEDMATFDILSAEPTKVLLDGKPIGKTPISGHIVAPGSHEVTFIDESGGNRTMVVTVQPGQAATVKSDGPPRIVRMAAPAEAEAQE